MGRERNHEQILRETFHPSLFLSHSFDLETLIYSLVRTCNDRRRKAYLSSHCVRRTRACPVCTISADRKCGLGEASSKNHGSCHDSSCRYEKAAGSCGSRWKIHLDASCCTGSNIFPPIFYRGPFATWAPSSLPIATPINNEANLTDGISFYPLVHFLLYNVCVCVCTECIYR